MGRVGFVGVGWTGSGPGLGFDMEFLGEVEGDIDGCTMIGTVDLVDYEGIVLSSRGHIQAVLVTHTNLPPHPPSSNPASIPSPSRITTSDCA